MGIFMMNFTEFINDMKLCCCNCYGQVLQTREELMDVNIYHCVQGLGQVGCVDYGLTHRRHGCPKSSVLLPALMPFEICNEQLCSSLGRIFAQAAGAAFLPCTAVYALPLLDNE